MEQTKSIKQEFGRTMYRLGMSRRQLVIEVAERNKVTLKTVYKWLQGEDDVKVGVLLETLKDIEESNKPKVVKEYDDDFFES